MDSSIALLPQVTIDDVHAAVDGMNVVDFLARTRPLLPYVPDVAEGSEEELLRALLEVELPNEADSLSEWLEPYVTAGTTENWLSLIIRLRVRGQEDSSALADSRVLETASFVAEGDSRALRIWRSEVGGRRTEVLRPIARTLGVEFRREPGSWHQAQVPPHPKAAASNLDALVDELVRRVKLTVGGDEYLMTETAPRAVAVLASTVATILGHKSSQRTYGSRRVVRADVYRKVFDALELTPFFESARRILEERHPHALLVEGPWPSGPNTRNRRLNVLHYENDLLVFDETARLKDLLFSSR